MKGLIDWLQALYHQQFLFPQKERDRLLRVISLRVRAGMSLADLFLSLDAIGTKNYKRIAAMSMESHGETGYYTAKWTKSHMWPKRDALLLTLGERQGAIADVADVLRNRMEDRLSFFSQVVSPNVMWLFGMLAMVATVIYLMSQLDLIMRFMEEEPSFVLYGRLMQDYGVLALSLLAGAWLAHQMAGARLHGPPRQWLRKVGVFAVLDRKFAIDLMRLWHILFRLGVSPVDSVLAVMTLYDGQPQRVAALSEALARIDAGAPFPRAIAGDCLPDAYANFLSSMSPMGDMEECRNAFPIIAQMLEDDAEGALAECKWIMQFAFILPMLGLIFSVLPLVTGAGMTM